MYTHRCEIRFTSKVLKIILAFSQACSLREFTLNAIFFRNFLLNLNTKLRGTCSCMYTNNNELSSESTESQSPNYSITLPFSSKTLPCPPDTRCYFFFSRQRRKYRRTLSTTDIFVSVQTIRSQISQSTTQKLLSPKKM